MTTSYTGATSSTVLEDRNDMERLVKGPNAYRTISEVADELHVPQHVLRFWETRFPEVKPLKRGGGRRYYSPEDIELLRHITDLLYVQGYTIKGVQRVLKEHQQADSVVIQEAPVEVLVVPMAEAEEATRSSFDIPSFPVSDTHDSASSGPIESAVCSEVVLSGEADKQDIRTLSGESPPKQEEKVVEDAALAMVDPGEETSAASPDEAEEHAEQDDIQSASVSDQDVEALLRDELAELRLRQERWKQERRALRLALEDVLGELDNLRQMVPSS